MSTGEYRIPADAEPLSMPGPRIGGRRWWSSHPMAELVARRTVAGLLTLILVSIVIFVATEILPGNAAFAVLGHSATPTRLHQVEVQLGLDQDLFTRYWNWASGIVTGHFGHSLVSGLGLGQTTATGQTSAQGDSVWSLVGPRLVDSAVLMVLAGLIGTVLGLVLGAYAAVRQDKLFDRVFSVVALAATALPEFVVAIALTIVFATVVTHLLPAVSQLPPGTYPWSRPLELVLPVATLVIVIVPYLYRMMRATTIEALGSDYAEMAALKGASPIRIVLVHALPNAIAPTSQVIGLTFLYLAGGIVIVENVFNYPGLGTGLVQAVNARDVPTIQFIVLLLAAFYIFVNIATDVIALLGTPRRRFPR